MCGLAGVIDLKGRREPDRAQVARMGAALTHRGPDETGTLFAPGIGAIQQRLSIVGLGNGQQPIFNEDRTVAVICMASCSITPSARLSFRRAATSFGAVATAS
jgi:asparagine synthase (glutamine-hydrolysing)